MMSTHSSRFGSVMRAVRYPLAIILIVCVLYFLPERTRIAPRISDDNAYIFLAADRLFEGEGLTSIVPHAPLQPWTWTADWSHLTRWPAGYPLLICATRLVTGLPTVAAAQLIALVSCAAALVGWFVWLRRALPGGITALLLSLVGAASAVSVDVLVNPASDTLVVAALPWLLLLAHRVVSRSNRGGDRIGGLMKMLAFVGLGIAAGAMFWIRYAGLFIPAGIGLYLVFEWVRQGRRNPTNHQELQPRRVGMVECSLYALGAALPILALVAINRHLSPAGQIQQQLNLGSRVGLDFSPSMLTTAWQQWTEMPFYSYKWYSGWFFSLVLPAGVWGMVLLSRRSRLALGELFRRPPVMISAAVVVTLFAMLILCSSLFQSKYDYVGLERYYRPIKPLYFLLLLGPVLVLRPKVIRIGACVGLLLACSWFVQVEWPRPYRRWLAANRPVTEYGRWARCFEPHSAALYDWIRGQDDPNLIVVSNFQDEIALETHVPALPVPRDAATLTEWTRRIQEARQIEQPRVLFLLDPDLHERDYFLRPIEEVVAAFRLTPARNVPPRIAPYVYAPTAVTALRHP